MDGVQLLLTGGGTEHLAGRVTGGEQVLTGTQQQARDVIPTVTCNTSCNKTDDVIPTGTCNTACNEAVTRVP